MKLALVNTLLFGTVIFAVATLFRIIFSLVKRNKR